MDADDEVLSVESEFERFGAGPQPGIARFRNVLEGKDECRTVLCEAPIPAAEC